MVDREQINIRVDPSQKQRWEQYAETDDRVSGGLSGLIRTAVEAYIDPERSEQSGDATTAELPDDLAQRLTTIEESVQDIERLAERTDETVGFIEQELFGPDKKQFDDRLIRAIPPARPYSERWESDKRQYQDTRFGEPIAWDGTVEALADAIDADEDMVETSLDALIQRQESFVETAIIDDDQRYWTTRNVESQPYADGRNVKEEQKRRRFQNRQEGRR